MKLIFSPFNLKWVLFRTLVTLVVFNPAVLTCLYQEAEGGGPRPEAAEGVIRRMVRGSEVEAVRPPAARLGRSPIFHEMEEIGRYLRFSLIRLMINL